jgi:hypothetical protein
MTSPWPGQLGRQRAAMPFVHLERDLWDLRDASGLSASVPARRQTRRIDVRYR